MDQALSNVSVIYLWFGSTVIDQVNLIDCLRTLREQSNPVGEVRRICPERPLWEFRSRELSAVVESNRTVEEQGFEVAAACWTAFRNAPSGSLEHFIQAHRNSDPELTRALSGFLAELPSTVGNLTKLEERLLRVVLEGGGLSAVEVWSNATDRDDGLLSDLKSTLIREYLERMSSAHPALVKFAGASSGPCEALDEEAFWMTKITATDAGKEMLTGRGSITLRIRRKWLGPFDLSGAHAGWRWDRSAEKVVRDE